MHVSDHRRTPAPAFPLVSHKAWSTVPEEGPPEHGHLLNMDEGTLARISPHAVTEGGRTDEILIWSPPYAARPRSGLRWGYTVTDKDGDLYAFQRVVYPPERVTPFLENACGTFVLAREVNASAW